MQFHAVVVAVSSSSSTLSSSAPGLSVLYISSLLKVPEGPQDDGLRGSPDSPLPHYENNNNLYGYPSPHSEYRSDGEIEIGEKGQKRVSSLLKVPEGAVVNFEVPPASALGSPHPRTTTTTTCTATRRRTRSTRESARSISGRRRTSCEASPENERADEAAREPVARRRRRGVRSPSFIRRDSI